MKMIRSVLISSVLLISIMSALAETIEEPEFPIQLQVLLRDDALHQNDNIQPRIIVKNIGDAPVSNFKYYYFFQTEYDQIPILKDYYTPNCEVSLGSLGDNKYVIMYDFQGVTLKPGEVSTEGGNNISVHYTGYGEFDKSNDPSNCNSTQFVETDKVPVFIDDHLIWGTIPEFQESQTPVVAVEAWSKNVGNSYHSQPCIYIKNSGETVLKELIAYYYFTTEEGKEPTLADYYTPNSEVTLEALGEDQYRLVYRFTHSGLMPNEAVPNSGGNVVGLNYADWSVWNYDNDYSHSVGGFIKNEHIVVEDANGKILFGVHPKPPVLYPFTNVTDVVGLRGKKGFRLSIADINGDGYDDIHVSERLFADENGRVIERPFMYQFNPQRGTYDDVSESCGLRTHRRVDPSEAAFSRRSSGAVFADVDNDGDIDCFSFILINGENPEELHGDRNDLYLNDGTGTFTLADATSFHKETHPLLVGDSSVYFRSTSATWMDMDKDGNIDLIVGNHYAGYAEFEPFGTQVYKNDGATFNNITLQTGLATETPIVTMGITPLDWNNDGWMDLMEPVYGRMKGLGMSRLMTNTGSVTSGWFSTVGTTDYGRDVGLRCDSERMPMPQFDWYKPSSFGSIPRDFDNDGDMDVLELLTHGWQGPTRSGIEAARSCLLVNNGTDFIWDYGRFEERTRDTDGNIFHHGDHYACWLDFDNDGLSDFVLTENGYNNNGMYLYKQNRDNTFSLVTDQSSLLDINDAFEGKGYSTHNVIPFDYDHDGDEDLLVGTGDDQIMLWRNDVSNNKNWIQVVLNGDDKSNGLAIGAKVVISDGTNEYTRYVDAGVGNHSQQGSLTLHFGVDMAENVDINVYWPNAEGSHHSFNSVAVNRRYHISESNGIVDAQ